MRKAAKAQQRPDVDDSVARKRKRGDSEQVDDGDEEKVG